MKVSPLHPEDDLSEEDQRAEGLEDTDIIKYNQEVLFFNESSSLGEVKPLAINYNRDAFLEVFRSLRGSEERELL